MASRTLKSILTVLLFAALESGASILSPSALARERGCEQHLVELHTETKFELVMTELRRKDLPSLLKDYDNKKLKIEFSSPISVRRFELDWNTDWMGHHILNVRNLPWGDLRERQLTIWKTAVALYQLQLVRRWYFYRSASAADLDRDMDKLAASLTELKGMELGRGHFKSYLKKAKRLAIVLILSGLAHAAIDQAMPLFIEEPPPYTALTENVDQKITAEKLRLERSIVFLEAQPASDAAEISALKAELKTLCQTFEEVCQLPVAVQHGQ